MDALNAWFYAYMVAILISTGLSAAFQYKGFHAMEEHEKNPYDRLR